MRTTFCRLTLLLALASAGGSAALAADHGAAPEHKPGTVTVSQASITYHAQSGDTLMSIARQYTTRIDNWAALGRINRIEKDVSIPIGTAILIPAELLADDAIEAKVAALSGTVSARGGDGRGVRLAVGATIVEGMVIETGANGFLTIALPDASRVSIPSNSSVRVSKLRTTRYTRSPRTELTLQRGRVESRVSPLDQNRGKFEVHTPNSVAGVRGTHFRVGIHGNGTVNEVLDGKVAVGKAQRGNGAADGVLLASARGAVSTREGVGPVVDLLPAPQIVAPPDHDYAAPRFTLSPVAGAVAYHVQISHDRDAIDMIAENRAGEPRVSIDGLRDGRYFMHVSAIDRSGLEGLVRSQEFTLRARPEAARAAALFAPYVDRSDERTVTLRWQAQPGKGYQLQVARDGDFTWLIHTSRPGKPEATMPRPAFGTYYARVQVLDADGNAVALSAVQPFIVTDHWVINDGSQAKMRNAPAETAR